MSLAHPRCCTIKLQVPVSSRGGRPYESRLGTCRTCKKVDSRSLKADGLSRVLSDRFADSINDQR